MNAFRIRAGEKRQRGFSLVEATFSIGILSFGFLSLAPLLATGMNTARFAREDRTSAQIAQTLLEEARQGTLAAGPAYLDFQGGTCASNDAAYTAQATSNVMTGSASLTQLALRVTPRGAPDRARIYGVVFQTPPAPAP